MFRLTPAAAAFVVVIALVLVGLMFAFSFKVTWSSFCQLWQPKQTLRFFRHLPSWRPRFSLSKLLFAAIVSPAVLAWLYFAIRFGIEPSIFVGLILLVALSPLLYVAILHFFEPSGRRRWKEHIEQKPDFDIDEPSDREH
jgi:hypothetical protein